MDTPWLKSQSYFTPAPIAKKSKIPAETGVGFVLFCTKWLQIRNFLAIGFTDAGGSLGQMAFVPQRRPIAQGAKFQQVLGRRDFSAG
jgi:hypothetical protein